MTWNERCLASDRSFFPALQNQVIWHTLLFYTEDWPRTESSILNGTLLTAISLSIAKEKQKMPLKRYIKTNRFIRGWIPYTRNFSCQEILVKMTLGGCVKFSLSPFFCYFKDSQWRHIVGFYFSMCLFLAISGRSRTQRKLNPHEKFPIYNIMSNCYTIYSTSAHIIYCWQNVTLNFHSNYSQKTLLNILSGLWIYHLPSKNYYMYNTLTFCVVYGDVRSGSHYYKH